MHKLFPITTVAVIGLLLIGAPHAMSLLNGKLPLTDPWKERFTDVTKLNAYAKTQPVELANVEIKNKNIDGVVLNGGKFENTDWTQISAKGANLTNVVFRKGTLEAVDFTDSTLTNVTFEDVTLREVRFFGPTLTNVRFVRCEFDAVNIDRTKNSRIEVIDSKIENSSLSRGQLIAVFRNSKLSDQTALTSLQPPSSLTFEKSELDDVDLSRSVLNELILDTVKSRKSGFVTGTIRKVTITGDDISFGFSETQIDQLQVQNINTVGLALDDAVVKTMIISDCRAMRSLNLYRARIGLLDISSCSPNNFRPREANIDTLWVKHGSITNSKFEGMKAKTFILENVSLDGELNFTNAQIGDLKTHNVIQQPSLKLITTGSNVRF